VARQPLPVSSLVQRNRPPCSSASHCATRKPDPQVARHARGFRGPNQGILGQAGAIVFDDQLPHGAPPTGAQPQPARRPARERALGVEHQVQGDLQDDSLAGGDGGIVRLRRFDRGVDAQAGQRVAPQAEDPPGDPRQRDAHGTVGGIGVEREQLDQHPRGAPGAGADAPRAPQHGLVRTRHRLQELGVAADHLQDVIDLVNRVLEQPRDNCQAIGSHQPRQRRQRRRRPAVDQIANQDADEHLVLGLERTDPDLGWKFVPVLPQAVHVEGGADPAHLRLGKIPLPMFTGPLTEALGQEDLDGFPEELVTSIPEHTLRPGIQGHDRPGPVDDDHHLGRRILGPVERFTIGRVRIELCHTGPRLGDVARAALAGMAIQKCDVRSALA
jgi:hypothetical protein